MSTRRTGTRTKYKAQNKQIFGVEYNKESKEIIFAAMVNFKPLICKVLGNKTFPIKTLKENASNGLMMKYKQVCDTHLFWHLPV